MEEAHKIQGSPEWIAWRKTKVTASEIPIIIGKSKWMTAYQLWQQKLGFTDGIKDNWAMKRGRDLEPVVRDLCNEEIGFTFVPEVVVHKEINWAAASLDGIDRENKAILEIKCPGLADHQKAEKDEIPEHYKPQVQWQMFCSDLEICYYASYYNNELVIVKISRDDDYIANELLPQSAEFYRCMIDMEEPYRSEDEYIQIVDDEFEEHARNWKSAKESADLFNEKEKYYKNKLISYTDDSNCKGYGLTICRIQREGSVDWKSLWKDLKEHYPDAAKKLSLEEYRKPSIGYWKISSEKD